MEEPRWLQWARELQALAQTGFAFSRDPYDRQRYETLRGLAADMLAAHTDAPRSAIVDLLRHDAGYATPKLEVRAAVFDASGRILMVREVQDHHRWTLPGGWADVGISPAANTVKEVREEAGYDVRVVKLAGAWDRQSQGHPPSMWACCKLFFICELIGGEARTSIETSEVGWFARGEVPADLSLGRVLPRQIERLFAHAANPDLPTDFD